LFLSVVSIIEPITNLEPGGTVMNLDVISRAEKEFVGTELVEQVVELLEGIRALAGDLQDGEDGMTPSQVVAYLELQREGLLAAVQGLTRRIDRLKNPKITTVPIKARARHAVEEALADLFGKFDTEATDIVVSSK
jgi:hypothetical protein